MSLTLPSELPSDAAAWVRLTLSDGAVCEAGRGGFEPATLPAAAPSCAALAARTRDGLSIMLRPGATPMACPRCAAPLDDEVACRREFDELLARDFSDYRYARSHRQLVDAYSLQHPEAFMRSGKSFAAHLTGACAALEHADPEGVHAAVRRWLDGPRALAKPAHIPSIRGDVTLLAAHAASDPDAHRAAIVRWLESAWAAWAEHHALARRWIAEAQAFSGA